MISRSAYAQLQYSPLLLLGTLVAMALVYLAPVLIVLVGGPPQPGCGTDRLALMAVAFQPTLWHYESLAPLGGVSPCHCICVSDVHDEFCLSILHGPRRHVERPRPGQPVRVPMTAALGPACSVQDPPAATRIFPSRRDHSSAAPWADRSRHSTISSARRTISPITPRYSRSRNSICWTVWKTACSVATTISPKPRSPHRALAERRSMAPKHAQDLLNAFRLDVTKLRY